MTDLFSRFKRFLERFTGNSDLGFVVGLLERCSF